MSWCEFDYLSGSINIPFQAPGNWEKEGLTAFYQDPNNPEWGGALCRVLYHESLHFWQFLASGYLANLVAKEWQRLAKFKQTGEIGDLSPEVVGYKKKSDEYPFSPMEMVECLARYWDVHTRSPVKIIEEEKIQVEMPNLLERPGLNRNKKDYTNIAFDAVMQKGRDCTSYAAPYRWMLKQTFGNSFFVALVFPIMAQFAFGSPDPVGVFCNSFERAFKSQDFHKELEQHITGNINTDWAQFWRLIQEIVYKELIDRRLPTFTSGIEVINRGPLKNHPIYREYLIKASSLVLRLKIVASNYEKSPAKIEEIENRYLIKLANIDPGLVYGLPGQPIFRLLLGVHLPPPSVIFENFNFYAKRPKVFVDDEIRRGVKTAENYEITSKALCDFIREFRAAEYAVSLGQDPKSFVVK